MAPLAAALARGGDGASSSGRFRGKLADRPLGQSYALTDKLLGRGGYGEVWQGVELASGEAVAIKVVGGSSSYRPATALAELEALAVVGRHRSLVGVREAFAEGGRLYLTMDLMAGGDLCDALLSRTEPFSEAEAKRAMWALLGGLAHCHSRGVTHRDVKLDNVFLRAPGDLSSACLGDFGMAHLHTWGAARGSPGSPQYMAPETLPALDFMAEPPSHGPPADLWSTGVLMFSLLAKRFPFSGSSSSELQARIRAGDYNFNLQCWDNVSKEAKDLLDRLFVLDPAGRPTARDALKHPWFKALRDELRATRSDKLSRQHREAEGPSSKSPRDGPCSEHDTPQGWPRKTLRALTKRGWFPSSGSSPGEELQQPVKVWRAWRLPGVSPPPTPRLVATSC